ncbi:MAG: hypothetical protein VYA55_15760 [Pseudomonadota bacterium]|nr:hypothetical protein [Pseudomonadota bacterium]
MEFTSELLVNVSKEKQSEILNGIFNYYIEQNGVGAMSKSDFDALVVYLYVQHVKKAKFDSFELSGELKLTESRLKGLYEKAEIKFSQIEEGDAWVELLKIMSNTKFEVESLEKGQVHFKLDNPALYRYFQKRIREFGTAKYSKGEERVTISLLTLFEVLERVDELSESEFKTRSLDDIKKNREATLKKIVTSLPKKTREKIKGDAKGLPNQLASAFSAAANLATIWSVIAVLL